VAATVISFLVLKSTYQISFPIKLFGKLFTAYLFVLLSFATVFFQDNIIRYIAGIVALLAATLFSFYKLNELMDLKAIILTKLKRQ
jgi:hypothetical protein